MFSYQKYGYIGLPLGNRQNFFEKVLAALDGEMLTPTSYGWFHLLCIAIVIVSTVIVFKKARNLSDKQLDLILLSVASALLALEIYKQLNYSYDWENDKWSYRWFAFPFQFCSTPMYVMFASVMIKNQKARQSMYAFLATYGLFAGTAVMIYPNDVFTENIGVNMQTMVHHGSMIVIGILMYVSGRAKLTHKTVLYGLPTFAILAGSAMIMNILYEIFGDPEQTFNMFYISPYYTCTLPVLSIIYPLVPYPVFLVIYTFGFTIAGYVMLLIAISANLIYQKQTAKSKRKEKV